MSARHNWRIGLSSSMSGKKWLKVLRGEVNYRDVARWLGLQVRDLFRRKATPPSDVNEIESSFVTLRNHGVRVLHVFSEGDIGLDYFKLMVGDRMQELRASGSLNVEIIPGSNHTFTLLENQAELLAIARKWAHAL